MNTRPGYRVASSSMGPSGSQLLDGARSTGDGEEELIVDSRAPMRPSQMVEAKLFALLKGDCLGVSQLLLKRLILERN
jgi:hypothetical protein